MANLGKTIPPEIRQKISQGHIGKIVSIQTRQKLSRLARTPERIQKMLKCILTRPTSYERKIIDVAQKYHLPFRYVGDGEVILNYVNPDFIATNGQKLLIEVYCKYWHPEHYEISRAARFTKVGYRTLFLSDDDMCSKNWEQICLSKIEDFLSGAI
jgi:hypothetical protein